MIQIFQIATDIIIYNVVHTGANTQLGGLKLGKIISEYHGSLNEVVVKPPIADAVKVIKSIKNRDKFSFYLMIPYFLWSSYALILNTSIFLLN